MLVSAFASALAIGAAQPAQDAAVLAAQPAAAPTEGVIAYPPEFFAASQPTTALDMLSRLPGFAVDTGDTVRGFEGAAGNVLLDGQRPATKTDNLEEILRRVPASQVARIDLIRGGAPGIDMQGKSVLANVIRKPGGGFQGVAAVSGRAVYDGRQTLTGRVELSGGDGSRAWEASATYGKGVDDGSGEGPGLRVAPDGTVLRRSDIDEEGDTVQTTLTGSYAMPLLGGRAKINARLFNDDYKFDEQTVVRFPALEYSSGIENSDKLETEIGGSFIRDLGARTSMELIGIRQDAQRDISSVSRSPSLTSAFALDRKTSETIGRAVFKHQPSERLSLETGGEVAVNVLESKTSYARNGVAVPLPAANVRVEERRGEVFAKGVWRPSPQWTLEAGLRYEGSAIESSGDVDLEKTLYFLKPRVAATWAPTKSTQLRLRFERVVAQLNFDDFVAESSLNTGVITAGNPDLSPEQAWVSEAAVEQRFTNGVVIVLTARHFALTDVIDRAPTFLPTGVFDAPSNIGDGTKDEIAVNLSLPLEPFGFKGATIRGESTWRRSEVTDPTTGGKREISNLKPVEWELHFTHDLPAYRLNWGVDVFGGWRESFYRFDEITTDKLKTFVTPFIEWKPRPDIVVRAEMQNATSRGFRHTRAIYDGPRSTTPLQYIDDRDIQIGSIYWVRVRKTFGT
jgi:outer membrane receptor protein involved in Fe transport